MRCCDLHFDISWLMSLLEIRDLKKHFPIGEGLFSRNKGAVKAVDGVNLTRQRRRNSRLGRRVGLRQIDFGANAFSG